jgi:hypothetical protein
VKQLASAAESAEGFVFDGPTSDTRLDEPGKFPGMEDSPFKYVADLFNIRDDVQALSQFNGYAIWINTGEWTPGGMFVSSTGDATGYGLGLLTHELLHKQMVGGGFSHQQMDQALNSAGAPNPVAPKQTNPEASRIDQICF